MDIKHLTLKNAKGLQYDIDLDLSDKVGIIGICGDNGVGKSTLLWHLTPYADDVLKGWTLKHRFDDGGYKKLMYNMQGKVHEIEIRMEKKDALCSYKIDSKEMNESLKYKLYAGIVEEQFMPLELATHSIYSVEATSTARGKNGTLTASLAMLDPKQRKNFFIQLLGLETYTTRFEIAHRHRTELEKEIDGLHTSLASIEEILQTLHKPVDLDALKVRLDNLMVLYTALEKAHTNYKQYQRLLEEGESIGKKENLEKELAELTVQGDTIRSTLTSMSTDMYADLKKQKAELESAYNDKTKKLESLKKVKVLINKGKELKGLYDEIVIKLNSAESKVKMLKQMKIYAENMSQSAKNVPCSEDLKTKCPLYNYTTMYNAEDYSNAMKERDKLSSDEHKYKRELDEHRSAVKKLLSSTGVQLDDIDNEIGKIDTEIKTMKKQLSELAVTLDSFQDKYKEYQDKTQKLKSISNEKASLKARILRLSDIKRELANLAPSIEGYDEKELQSTAQEIAKLRASIESEMVNKENYQKYEKRKAELQAQIDEKEKLYKNWKILEEAFDSKGIIMYELENLCPSVTELANELLEDTPYKVRLDTYKYKNKGKANESIKEIFDLIITVDGEARSYIELSAGQRVLPDLAISQAASTVLSQQYAMNSIFLDERDGSLSVSNRLHYIDMLRKAHRLSKRKNTFIISHDPAVWSACDWLIYLGKDGYEIDRPENMGGRL